jgi:hypothetical protein
VAVRRLPQPRVRRRPPGALYSGGRLDDRHKALQANTDDPTALSVDGRPVYHRVDANGGVLGGGGIGLLVPPAGQLDTASRKVGSVPVEALYFAMNVAQAVVLPVTSVVVHWPPSWLSSV